MSVNLSLSLRTFGETAAALFSHSDGSRSLVVRYAVTGRRDCVTSPKSVANLNI